MGLSNTLTIIEARIRILLSVFCILATYVSSPGCWSTRLTNNSGFSLRHFCTA